jgi:glycerol-3-phosphate acyltransferase PlsY
MGIINLLFLLLGAYLLGSIPTAVWVGKFFYNLDVREHGSGNAGTTNTFRILGWKAGIPVFIIDVFKGWIALKLVLFSNYIPGNISYMNFQMLLGASALTGHIFPVFAGFKGGKGVASMLGMGIALTPVPAVLGFGIFALILLITKYVSLGSMGAGVSYPVMLLTIFKTHMISMLLFSMAVAILLIITHRKNIKRLLKGEESKARFLIKRKSDY